MPGPLRLDVGERTRFPLRDAIRAIDEIALSRALLHKKPPSHLISSHLSASFTSHTSLLWHEWISSFKSICIQNVPEIDCSNSTADRVNRYGLNLALHYRYPATQQAETISIVTKREGKYVPSFHDEVHFSTLCQILADR